MRIRHVVGKRTRLSFPQRILTPLQDVFLCGRFPMAPLMKQIGAEERAFLLFKEDAGIPPVRHMRSGQESKAISTGRKDIVPGQNTSRSNRKIIHAHHSSDEAANGLRAGSEFKPV